MTSFPEVRTITGLFPKKQRPGLSMVGCLKFRTRGYLMAWLRSLVLFGPLQVVSSIHKAKSSEPPNFTPTCLNHLNSPPTITSARNTYKWRFALGKLCRIPFQLPKPSKSLGRFISFIMDSTFKKSWYVFGLKLV